jgi:hypothetical protein
MSSFSFCSSCDRNRERRFNCDFIDFIKLDFVLFCTLLCLFSLSEIQRWIVSLCDFVYVLFHSRSAILHLSTVVSISAKSLSHTISFQCITHFIDEWIFYNWIFSLMNHKEKTLLLIFKDLINQCDRIEFDERAIIRIIRIDQEIFINKKFENWMREQEINWD